MQKLWLTILLSLVMGLHLSAQEPTQTYRSLEHDGLERSYTLYTPPGEVSAVVIALHPVASSGNALAAMSTFHASANERGWAVAYPNATGFYWDDGRSAANLPPQNGTIDDHGFITALASTLSAEFNTTTRYLVGMGNGGTMALQIACTVPEAFTGIGVVAALMWEYQLADCVENPTPVNLLFIYGQQDVIYPENGRTIESDTGETWRILSASQTIDFWANRNACNPDSAVGFGQSTLILVPECGEETITAFHPLVGASNTWPRMSNNIVNRFGVDATRILTAFFAQDENWAETTAQTTLSLGTPRSYNLYVPSTYDGTTPLPVVVALHGRGANGANQAYTSGMNAVAEREGFIALYPDGYDPNFEDPTWNYGRNIPIYGTDSRDDDQFIRDLLDDTATTLNIDANRIYITGLSNGGFMTQRLACTDGDRYAAFASVAATAPYGITQLCAGTSAVPMLLVHGTADAIVPWQGMTGTHPQSGETVYITAPMDATMAFWADHNRCGSQFISNQLLSNDEQSTPMLFEFDGCSADAPLVLYGLIGGGHVWPGVRDFQSDLFGEVNMDYNASELIWHFFQQFTLEGRVANNEPLLPVVIDPEVAQQPRPTPLPTTTAQPTSDPAETARFVVSQLQTGGFTIFTAIADSGATNCTSSGHLPEETRTQLETMAAVYQAWGLQFDRVMISDDCAAETAAMILAGPATHQLTSLDPGGLLLLLSRQPAENTLNLVIASPILINAAISSDLESGESIILRPLGSDGLEPMTTVSQSGWLRLAELAGYTIP